MSLTGRIAAAIDAFVSYSELNHIPRIGSDYDRWTKRIARYTEYEAHYNNTAYSTISAFSELLKAKHRLYKNVRGIYHPVSDYIDLLASAVYGGNLDTETFQRGAIPIKTDNPAVYDALRVLWRDSRWSEKKLEYVRTGANLGDVGLKVVDDRVRMKVRLEVLHPSIIRDVTFDDVGNVKRYIIQYQRTDDEAFRVVNGRLVENSDVRKWTYTEICDGDWFETYRDGYSYALFANALGEPVTRWQNEYGFVPLVIARYQEISGLKWGSNAYYPALPLIHEINDQASLLDDQIRKVVIPLLYAENITSADQIKKATASERDVFTILFGPRESTLTPIQSNIDIAAAGENIQNLLKALERKLPLLAWKRIREEGGNHTAPGIRAVTADAIWQTEATRSQFDAPLVRAQQMAMTMGGMGKYPGYEAFDENSYQRGETDHQITERPIIPDSLSLKEEAEVLHSAGAPLWLIMQRLGFNQKIIEQVTAENEAQKREEIRAAMSSIFGADDDDDDEQDEQTARIEEGLRNVEAART